MLDDNKPLMFINTISEVKSGKQQSIFDSRVNNSSDFREYKKLRNIIEMYNKGRPVLCKILTNGFDNVIIGIPFKFIDNKLYVKTNDAKEIQILEKDLKRVFIIRF